MNEKTVNQKIHETLERRPNVKLWYCSLDEGKSGWIYYESKEEGEQLIERLQRHGDPRAGSKVFPALEYPDYCNDLNLMRIAEEKLNVITYWDELQKTSGAWFHSNPTLAAAAFSGATARQRAEAFIRTVWPNSWKALIQC